VCNNGTTYVGQSVYITGNHSALGDWNLAQAIKLTPTTYPSWSTTLSLPANTTISWKCVKRDENNATAGVQWQAGANNSLTTSNSAATTTGGF
jgi:alpha-amylase